MKKIWTIVIAVLAALFLLSGCGEVTLEEKMEQVQKANTIKVQDIIDLMELEGLEVNKVAADDTFNNNWPNAVLVKVNDTHYVALKSFEENLWDRRNATSKIGWEGGFGSSLDENNAVRYIGQKYKTYPTGGYVPSYEYAAKNIVALVLPLYPDNIAELSKEEQYAVMEHINEVSTVIKNVFYYDINGMLSWKVAAESDNFKIDGTVYFYATGVVDEKAEREWTYYDAHTWLDCDVVCSDAIWEQYEGSAYEVRVKDPDGWTYSRGSGSSRSVLEYEDKKLNTPNCQTHEVLWSAPEKAPAYEMTITVVDITETFLLEPTI